jgi:hypothetical protein
VYLILRFVFAAATLGAMVSGFQEMCHAQATSIKSPDPVVAPWGVSASSSSYRDRDHWFPRMSAAGVTMVRLFPEWNSFEPERGKWNWEPGDALLKSAGDHNLEINAILMGAAHGAKGIHTFPVDNLDDWSRFVTTVVGRYHKRIRHWEVWNEGNGGFNDGQHTTIDYAKLAVATYQAARKADPQARLGLTVASFDVPYLQQTLLEMAKTGHPAAFDYLCVHPYEIADGLADPDGEVPLLWMASILKDMLKSTAPEKQDAEIWITEVSRRIQSTGQVVTEQEAAKSFAKIYTMSIAQGIRRIQWFEGQDPAGEDQGFGLLNRNGAERTAYQTLKAMTSILGASPRYLGWVALGRESRGYGFVFAGTQGPVLAAWMPAGLEDRSVSFPVDVQAGVASMAPSILKAGQFLELSDTPLFVTGLPNNFVTQAIENSSRPFPWRGNFSRAKVVTCEPGSPNKQGGIAQVGRHESPVIRFPDGSTGILVPGDIGHPVRFYVHPSFANFSRREYYVRATVRRVAEGNIGMNLLYEVADSKGKSPYANTGKWGGFSNETGWQTCTWQIQDACFSKMWGYDLVLRPEQSVPFVIGKLEVSTEPFP